MNEKKGSFCSSMQEQQISPDPIHKSRIACFSKRRTTKPELIESTKYDSGIISMMEKLGYDSKDIYNGLVMGTG